MLSGSSWLPVDLDAIVRGVLAGETVGPVPTLLVRDDGPPLIYPGEVHSIAGEPESGKGWIMLAESARLLAAGRRVLYIDFEDSPASIVGRLLALGVKASAIMGGRFAYVRPEEALTADALNDLFAKGRFALAIIDGLSEAYGLLSLDYTSNTDVPTFLQKLVRPIARTGAAVVQIDHVAKDKATRGRWAVGAGHKLAGVAVAYGVEVIDRPSREHTGRVKLILAKDRHGHIPGHVGSTVALVTIDPEDDGATVTVTLGTPDTVDSHGTFRPTTLMRRVSDAITLHPGMNKRAIRGAVKGSKDKIDLALELLIADGYVREERDGQARRHHIKKAYSEDEDDRRGGVAEPWRNRGAATAAGDRGGVAPLIGATTTGHGQTGKSNNGAVALDADAVEDGGWEEPCDCGSPWQPTDHAGHVCCSNGHQKVAAAS